MTKNKNAEIGNVYAIETKIGYGLFQVVQNNDAGIDVVRVLEPIIENVEQFSPELLGETERYFIKFMEVNGPEVNIDIEKNEEISEFILPAKETIDRVSYNNIDVKEDDIDDFMSDLI